MYSLPAILHVHEGDHLLREIGKGSQAVETVAPNMSYLLLLLLCYQNYTFERYLM